MQSTYKKFLLGAGIVVVLCAGYFFIHSFIQTKGLTQSFNGRTQTASVIDATDPNLVGYWPMDDGSGSVVTDASSAHDNGTFSGTVSWTAGNVGSGAAQFTGSNYMSIPDNSGLDFGTSTPFSVSVWVKTTGSSGVFINTNPAASNVPGYLVGFDGRGLYVDLRLSSAGSTNDCVIGDVNNSTTINDGNWHHIVAVVNRNPTCTINDVTMYIDHAAQSDKVDESSANATNQNLTGSAPIAIGGVQDYFSTITGAFTGSLDDLRIYNRALNSSEVNQLYQMGSAGASACSSGSCTAASCSLSDVQTAIGQVNDGDTVIVPAGICTWNSALLLAKTITLRGMGSSTGGTEIDYGGTGHVLIDIQAGVKTGHLDISGFMFSGGDPNFWDGTAIHINGPGGWKNLRIHDNVFKNVIQYAIKGFSYTDALIDNNIFQGTGNAIELNGVGASDWTSPLTLGTSDFFFIEGNTFIWNDDQGNEGHIAADFTNGGRGVLRNNQIRNGFFETHDRARGGFPSADAFEVYNNTFTDDSIKWEGINVSSGTGVIWGNTFVGSYQYPIGGLDYKTIDTADTYHNGTLPCDGNDPLDQNTTGQSGWRCQYQLGSQGVGASAVTVPVYIWSNTQSGTTTPVGLFITDGATHIQLGRDYFNNIPQPSYTPYQYPHPLHTGAVPVVYGACGVAATTYASGDSFPQGAYCSSGSVSPSSPANPTSGSPSAWSCTADTAVNCSATRSAPIVTPPADVTPPVISSISGGTPGTSGTTITWFTDEVSDSQVDYGLTTAYGNTTSLNTSLLTSHSVVLSNLSSYTVYHYRVRSKDALGNLATSSDQTLTTAQQSTSSSGGGIVGAGGGSTSSYVPPVTTTHTAPIPSVTPPTPVLPKLLVSPVSSSLVSKSIYRGVSDSQVTIVQHILISEGFLSKNLATGYFGQLTESAVGSFQAKYGIVNSGSPTTTGFGSVGAKTRTLINQFIQQGKYTGVTTTTVTQKSTAGAVSQVTPQWIFTLTLGLGSSNEQVRLLQKYLNSHTFYVAQKGPGSVGQENTYFGQTTLNALLRFQNQYNLTKTGLLDVPTRKLISSLPA